jgi:hypothetical protein
MPTDLAGWTALVTPLVKEWGAWGVLVAVVALAIWALRWLLRRHARLTVILLREVCINLIQNGPVTLPPQQQANRVNENITWWESEVAKALESTGASRGQISKFTTLGTLNRGNLIADKLDALESIIRRWDGAK